MTEAELMEIYVNSPYLQFVAREDNPSDGDEMYSYITDDRPGKIVLGGTGSSKTYTTAWLFSKMLYTSKAPAMNTPVWVISQNLDMSGVIWSQALSKFIPEDQISYIRWRKRLLYPEIVMLKNGFNIHFFSCEQGRAALQASNIWAAWIDEQAPQHIIEEVWGRLRAWDHPNQFLYSLTPLDPDPFLQDLYDRKDEPEVSGLYKFYHLNTIKNPHITEEWRKNYLDSLPPDVRLTRQYGQFASYRGAVYPEFSNDLADKLWPVDMEGERFLICDFGFHNPAALWMIKVNDIYYVVDDMQLHDEMPDIFAKKIKERRYDHRWKVIVDYEDAISIRYLNQAGIVTTGARKNVVDGINNMKSLMFCKKFFVSKNCKETIRQLKSYQWKEASQGKNAGDPPDEVKKINDHLADCCFSDDTEILTKKGWKLFQNTNHEDLFATVNLNKDIIEYQKATRFIEKKCEKMIEIVNKKLNVCITPDHNMVVIPRKTIGGKTVTINPPEFRKASELKLFDKLKLKSYWIGEDKFILPKVEGQNTNQIEILDLGDFAEFMGWYLSEGSYDDSKNKLANNNRWEVRIAQTKLDGREKIQNLLNKLPWKWWKNHYTFGTVNKQLCIYLSQFGNKYDKFVPQWIKDATPSTINRFLDGYVGGDGWVVKGLRRTCSVSKKLSDDIQELFIKVNSTASVCVRKAKPYCIKGRKGNNTKDQYWVREQSSPYGLLRDSKNKFHPLEIDYDRNVYCVSVPNETLIVRRNGKLCICGNCRYGTYTTLKSIIKPWDAAPGPKPIKLVKPTQNPLLRGRMEQRR